jgi:hypothetical protein
MTITWTVFNLKQGDLTTRSSGAVRSERINPFEACRRTEHKRAIISFCLVIDHSRDSGLWHLLGAHALALRSLLACQVRPELGYYISRKKAWSYC